MKTNVVTYLKDKFNVNVKEATNEQVYDALLSCVKDELALRPRFDGERKLYYVSAEFLIGKLLSNNLINLGVYDEINGLLEENGKHLSTIEEIENEPSLGNGGLGRLAACFLDSIANLELPGDGIGLNYHLGLFRQKFVDNLQREVSDPWIEEKSWLCKQDVQFEVNLGKNKVVSTLYDIDVAGYHGGKNKLHLFDLDSVDESIVDDGISFDQTEIEKNLTLFLYPDDSTKKGELLRIYQQYFMVSNGAQFILYEHENKGYDIKDLDKHVAIQINDTHPSLIIPELIRLMEERGLDRDCAISIVEKTCAYTNHTILAEALEKWPLDYLEEVVPAKLIEIMVDLDARVKEKYPQECTHIIDEDGRFHMAAMDIHYGYKVNGVAAIHTEILKDSELNCFYKIYPEKFVNETNGITFRRWLMHCNPELTNYLSELIGDGFKEDAAELEKLLAYIDDASVHAKLREIKQGKKRELVKYLQETQGVLLDEEAVFDIQIKRLHEYKRQQMNALAIIHQYLEIKKGNYPARPLVYIFGGKAAPAYVIAKDIIHLILCMQELIEKDPIVSKYLRVVMIENYNVSKAEKLIPACDVSEQISLASKEASGTGNMKFMLNGAITIGTSDGANVEIDELVGDENIYIFGEEKDEVIEHYSKADYVSKEYYEKPMIKEMVDFIVSDELTTIGNTECLERLHNEFINKDWFMALLDVESYIETRQRLLVDFEDRDAWSRKMLVNIAKAGFFSSDRTIKGYNEDIWKLR